MNEPLLIANNNDHYLLSDTNFNELYPPGLQVQARRHWTPLHVVKLAVAFLAEKESKILDIGSGVGKFCLAGANYAPNVQFCGVEQRRNLFNHALKAQTALGLQNVNFINANFTQLNLQDFNHFYFFNSFYENIDDSDRIDEKIAYSEALYEYYVRYLRNALQQMPDGTKIVTYHSFKDEIPQGYELVGVHASGDLGFWIKNASR